MKDAQSDSQRKKAIRKNTSSTLDFIPACTPPMFDATAGLSEQMVNVMAMYQVKMSAEEESVLQLGHGTGSQREEQQRKSCEYLCVCVCVSCHAQYIWLHAQRLHLKDMMYHGRTVKVFQRTST